MYIFATMRLMSTLIGLILIFNSYGQLDSVGRTKAQRELFGVKPLKQISQGEEGKYGTPYPKNYQKRRPVQYMTPKPLTYEPVFSQYVNPFIGTGGHGHTFPVATVPFGMVQLSPDTRIDGSWDGCSGYHYSDSFIYGFSHTHLSGTGVSDYGDILLLPSVNPISFEPEEYKTKFSHDDEKAEANYYEVDLKNNGVKVKLTATMRSGFHEYKFESDEGNVLIDLRHRDKLLNHKLEQVDAITVRGYRVSSAWAKEQHCYFFSQFRSPIANIIYNEDSSQAVLHFEKLPNNTLRIDVGVSFTSMNGARENLMNDLSHFYGYPSMEYLIRRGQEYWDKELSKIEVFTKDENKKYIFYTALYHCMIHPNIAEDADGKYRGHDMKIHESPNHTQYTVFSLWDTYRALHPLMTIIDEQRTSDFINSFLEIYKQSGRLPVWELASNETDCMIGYHSVSVIADAYMKGIRGFDTTLALEAMVASANEDIFGLDSYKKYGFVRAEDESESVSKTLEYSYDDWCIAQMAAQMGQKKLAKVFYRRAESWRNIINPETGFATPRLNGDWLPNFDPKEVNLHFTEANSWQYSFVQHRGYFSELEEQLDSFFTENKQTTGRTQSDITGLIGQYAHGNEPSQHIAYLYNHTSHPEKGQKIIKQICDSFYTNAPNGLIGNEDCGQMSAWYVLSSTGIYPLSPGEPDYYIGLCLFDSVHYHLKGGNDFTISSDKNIGSDFYILSLDIAAPYEENIDAFQFYPSTVPHNYIKRGVETTFQSNFLGEVLGTEGFDPYKMHIMTPLIKGSTVFKDSTKVIVASPGWRGIDVKYFINDSFENVITYKEPIVLSKTSKISAYAVRRKEEYRRYEDEWINKISPTISATFYKKPNNWTCTPSISPNSQYTGGGADALIDGINGTNNWQAGRWQGYQHEEVMFDLDFKETKKVSEVSASFVQDARSWILMPSKVEVYHDGVLVGTTSYSPDAFTEGNFLETLTVKLDKRVKTDKLQIKIYSAGKLPKGHPGHTMDGDAFFFVDEIMVL